LNAVKLPQSESIANSQSLSVKNKVSQEQKQTHQTVQSEQLAQQGEKGSRIAISTAEEACEVIAG